MSVAPEPILTLADLARWSFPGTALAVIGQPIAHSVSPAMHNAALAELARAEPRFQDWHYFKFELAPEELPEALDLFHRYRFRGLNLTVPHKSLVVDRLAASDEFVRSARAANTLIHTDTGWRGANTDGFGLSVGLHRDLGVTLPGAHVVLLGAGGAARAAALECLHARCASLWIANRTPTTLASLLADLGPFASGTELHGFDPQQPPSGLPAGSVVINATSLGLKSTDGSPLDLTKIARPAHVYDMIYRPPQTSLLRQAAELGIANANGLSMLVHQGARSLALWTGLPSPVQIMQQAAQTALRTT